MFQHILVPLDGSRRAEVAIPAAARLARATRGTVILMRSIPTWIPYGPYVYSSAGYTATGPSPALLAEMRASVVGYLEQIAQSDSLAGVHTVIRATEGPAAENILTVSQEEKADLIAICARGLTGFHRWKLGGVSQHVIRHSATPVLLLPDPAPSAEPDAVVDPLAHAQRVLVPLDGSVFAETAIPAAIELVAALVPQEGELRLLQVVSPFTAEALEIPVDQLVGQTNEQLAQIAKRLSAPSTEHLRLNVTYSTIADADAAARILMVTNPQFATEGEATPRGYDVVVMASHGRTGILRWTLGSITERVIQEIRTPLLVVRPVATHKSLDAVPTENR